MTLEMIETFLVLANTQNFSRSAELMFVAQSTITNRIKQLEAELGCILFDRCSKSVSLTNAGKQFLQYAQEIHTLSQRSVEELRHYNHFKSSITVSATDAIWRYYLLPTMMRFVTAHSEISFEFLTKPSHEVVQQVVSGEADIGAVLSETFHPEMIQTTLFKDDFCLVAKPGLVDHDVTVTPQNISKYPYIHANWSKPFNMWFDKYYHFRNYHLEIEHVSHIGYIVLSGTGMAFFPHQVAKEYLEKGELISIPFDDGGKTPYYSGYLIYMKHHQNKLAALIHNISALNS